MKMMLPNEIFSKIIHEQSQIIGMTLAKSRAVDAGGINYDEIEDKVELSTNPKTALSNLLKSYGEIFGQASVDVCLDVIRTFPAEEIQEYIPDEYKDQLTK